MACRFCGFGKILLVHDEIAFNSFIHQWAEHSFLVVILQCYTFQFQLSILFFDVIPYTALIEQSQDVKGGGGGGGGYGPWTAAYQRLFFKRHILEIPGMIA